MAFFWAECLAYGDSCHQHIKSATRVSRSHDRKVDRKPQIVSTLDVYDIVSCLTRLQNALKRISRVMYIRAAGPCHLGMDLKEPCMYLCNKRRDEVLLRSIDIDKGE